MFSALARLFHHWNASAIEISENRIAFSVAGKAGAIETAGKYASV
jgi:hypothetical protein